jgi:hypothetical protein
MTTDPTRGPWPAPNHVTRDKLLRHAIGSTFTIPNGPHAGTEVTVTGRLDEGIGVAPTSGGPNFFLRAEHVPWTTTWEAPKPPTRSLAWPAPQPIPNVPRERKPKLPGPRTPRVIRKPRRTTRADLGAVQGLSFRNWASRYLDTLTTRGWEQVSFVITQKRRMLDGKPRTTGAGGHTAACVRKRNGAKGGPGFIRTPGCPGCKKLGGKAKGKR